MTLRYGNLGYHGPTEAEPCLVSRVGGHLPGAAPHRRPLHEQRRRVGGREQARDLQARDDVASVRAGEGPSDINMSDRRSLLIAALGFVLLGNWRTVRELVTLHAWLDTWSGLGAIVVGMERATDSRSPATRRSWGPTPSRETDAYWKSPVASCHGHRREPRHRRRSSCRHLTRRAGVRRRAEPRAALPSFSS